MSPKEELEFAVKCGFLIEPSKIGSTGRALWKAEEKKQEIRDLNCKIMVFVAAAIIAIIIGMDVGITERGDLRSYAISLAVGIAVSIPSLFLIDFYGKQRRKGLWLRLAKERDSGKNKSHPANADIPARQHDSSA